MNALLDRNPFTLSGGEQVCLVIATSLMLQPAALSLDGLLEQLDQLRRVILMEALNQAASKGTDVWIVDNRALEFVGNEALTEIPVESAVHPEDKFGSINPEPLSAEPVTSLGDLAFNDLSFAYGPFQVLKGATSRWTGGQVVHMTGQNGSGKSTLSKLLVGVIKPQSGSILIGNKEWEAHRSPGRHLAYHFQNPDLQLFTSSVLSELRLGSGQNSRRVDAVIEAFALAKVLETHPLDLPFAMRKRVALAATLTSPASWLIIDEPTLAQDDHNAKAIAEILLGEARNGRGVAVITHSEWFRSLLPGIRVRLDKGQVQEDGGT
jgi:energy-coupling factor transport system ATP-binding protein